MTLEQLKENKELYEKLGPGFMSRELMNFLFDSAIASASVAEDAVEGVQTPAEAVKPARRKKGE